MKSFFTSLSLVLFFNPLAQAKDCNPESFGTITEYSELASTIKESKKDIVILDVNSKSSFQSAHIKGAQRWHAIASDPKKVESLFAAKSKKDTTILAYCGGDYCTAWKDAAKKACEMGFEKITHYKPGISSLKKSDPKGLLVRAKKS